MIVSCCFSCNMFHRHAVTIWFADFVGLFYTVYVLLKLYLFDSVGGRGRGGRGHDGPAGTTVKICKGPFKGYRGRIIEFKGPNVRVELESQMKVVTGKSTYCTKNFHCWLLCLDGLLLFSFPCS